MATSSYGGQIKQQKQYEFDDDSILNKLPNSMKSGSPWIDHGDALLYFGVYAAACLFFYLLYHFWRVVFESINFKDYQDKDEQERVFFLILWTSQAHHVFVPTFALYNIYNSCLNQYGRMTADGTGSQSDNWAWWSDPTCRLEQNKGFVYNIMICIAFMTIEFLLIHFKIEKPSKLNIQTKYHHIWASLGLTMALFAGYGLPGNSNASLMCEFSSISLNYKDMFRSKKDTLLGQINQLIFLINYTIFRIVLFPLLVYYNIVNSYETIRYVSFFRQVCILLTCTSSILVGLLQFYWYHLIIKGLIKLLKDIGVIGNGATGARGSSLEDEANALMVPPLENDKSAIRKETIISQETGNNTTDSEQGQKKLSSQKNSRSGDSVDSGGAKR